MSSSDSSHVPSVVTIGNFDGVHLGHRYLLEHAKELAKERALVSVLVTFWPHPREIVRPNLPHRPLSEREERRILLSALEFDRLLELPFDKEMAALEPAMFVEKYLLPLKMSVLVIGHDFALGRGASGNFAALSALGRQYGFEVRQVEALEMDGQPVSSTRLRKCLEDGNVASVARFLGRPYSVCGEVVHGFGRGADLGFPTANLKPPRKLLPAIGVYASIAECDGRRFQAVTNIGKNPTFDGQKLTVESFLLDADENLYGRKLCLHFIDRIRGEVRFSSPDKLQEQIARDIATARAMLRQASATKPEMFRSAGRQA